MPDAIILPKGTIIHVDGVPAELCHPAQVISATLGTEAKRIEERIERLEARQSPPPPSAFYGR